MDYNYVGKGIPRIDGVEKVTGEAQYVQDISFKGMLYAKVKTSPYAHALIKSINTSKAKELPGVKAVLTGHEAYQKLGIYIVDKPILAVDKVRYFGEAVAAVAAVNIDIAERAIDLIEVEYEPLPVLLDVEEAVKPNAILIHPDLGNYKTIPGVFFPEANTNVSNHFKLKKGDIKKGFEESDLIIENKFYVPQILHVPMETHSVIAKWGTGDKIKIWSSAQSPFTLRNLFSIALNIPMENIEVIVPYIGGGFGGKAGIHLEPLIALLSKASNGKTVKFVATREEEISTLPCRQGLVATIKTGVKKSGKIVAEEIEYLWDAGAYADYGVNITRATGYSGAGPYDIENVKLDSETVYTNHLFGTAYRGFGHAEIFWAIERQMELVAKKLGIDSLEFRLKNLLRPGSITITGEPIHEQSGNVIKCIKTVADRIGWGKPKSEEEKVLEKKTGKYRGKGIAVLHKAPAMPSNAATSAIVQMNEDGSIRFNVAGIDMGQGSYTAMAQIIAERLHLPIEKVHVVFETDTDEAPYDWQTVASRMTILAGNAVIEACNDLKEQIFDMAAIVLRAAKHDLALGDECVYVKQFPEEKIYYSEIAVGYTYPNGNGIGGPLIGRGNSIAQGLTILDQETGQGRPALDWTFGAHAMEVEVDTNTGDTKIIKIVTAIDVGKVINEMAVKGQIVGGVVQGVGTAISEELKYNKEGKLLTKSFVDYKIPTMQDLPGSIEVYCIETPQLDGPYGARGCAEHPMISITSAMGNAIADATGVELFETPFTAEKVYKALNKCKH
ncbi:xanthine dehydrogenase family protein molybdopterin-binding subunit [Clostridium autoethanogenum]|uniref:Xanthine dehydrogenase family protein molybdopterin-binding subunit n=2 Tax=Clostridium autoethanogenum TaxID=84023 RepID=A0A3M0SEK1_9CLOT|nr:xanthine dehydrogenase family protein molybdopterin-binding subunit [Clostridium autoethanogenum]AGY74652.1 xanthine dehydrogenase family protein molybdopterin-binding subunit [Clostridium autoethanogenum DSM 10061]ALU34834.1 Xanthine dehydrogenase [Clostridium autoethanogenum DSM 10061]OVY51555.1 4-hydroxybenzoyl-CoA reductase subunit alpha [Clostridium autoethanogenum]RMC96933.1 xanthine dehydrogenase family protein molybdopterin-binding subunit [Clostridium autoethanogenum]